MGFSFKNYKPIDYRKWVIGNKARKGVNIKKLGILNQEELKIWDAAIPYQDQRDDPGQGEMVTIFAHELLKYYPADRGVAILGAIVHDIGQYGCDPDAWKKLVISGGDTEAISKRLPHQIRGSLLAGRIFEKIKYPNEKAQLEIADIIGDHDTRFLPTTNSGEIVRGADLLWRVTLPCLETYYKEKGVKEAYEIIQQDSIYMNPPKSLRKIEKQIGRIELANTLHYKFGNKVYDLLKKGNYGKELKKIVDFYR